jgi:hypothetical protein
VGDLNEIRTVGDMLRHWMLWHHRIDKVLVEGVSDEAVIIRSVH